MCKWSDLVGLELSIALPILKKNNCKFSVVETLSPKIEEKNSECRIVHIREKNNGILELIVSYF